MRRTVVAMGVAGIALASALVTPSVAAAPGDSIGTGKRVCVPAPGANCRDVAQKWTFEFHADLTGAKFARAKLHGADWRGARLDGANLRGVVLRHADLADASLRNVNFSPAHRSSRVARAVRTTSDCEWNNCNWVSADLSYANLTAAVFIGANFTDANLAYVNATAARLEYANFSGANLTNATFMSADMTGAILTGATLCNTQMPDGSIDNTGC